MSGTIRVAARLPANSLSSAAIGLGLDRNSATRTGIVRAALALFHGRDRATAMQLARPVHNSRLSGNASEQFTGDVDEELAKTGDVTVSYAIRVGLAMAAGYPRSEAEAWASMMKPGRPPKSSAASE